MCRKFIGGITCSKAFVQQQLWSSKYGRLERDSPHRVRSGRSYLASLSIFPTATKRWTVLVLWLQDDVTGCGERDEYPRIDVVVCISINHDDRNGTACTRLTDNVISTNSCTNYPPRAVPPFLLLPRDGFVSWVGPTTACELILFLAFFLFSMSSSMYPPSLFSCVFCFRLAVINTFC